MKHTSLQGDINFGWSTPSSFGSTSLQYTISFAKEDLTNKDDVGRVVQAQIARTNERIRIVTLEGFGFESGSGFYYQIKAFTDDQLVSQSDWLPINY